MDEIRLCQWELKNPEKNEYKTSCNDSFKLPEGDLKDNGYTYCPSCGRIIKNI